MKHIRIHQTLAAAGIAMALGAAVSAQAADKVRIGMVSTLSGPPGALGIDMRDGFNLALKHLGGKLGGLPADVAIAETMPVIKFAPDRLWMGTRPARAATCEIMRAVVVLPLVPDTRIEP